MKNRNEMLSLFEEEIEVPLKNEYTDRVVATPANPCVEFIEEKQGSLSCGGAYMPRVSEIVPFRKNYTCLHLMNSREQVILLKNLKPISITNLKGPSLSSREMIARFSDEDMPLKKFFRENIN